MHKQYFKSSLSYCIEVVQSTRVWLHPKGHVIKLGCHELIDRSGKNTRSNRNSATEKCILYLLD